MLRVTCILLIVGIAGLGTGCAGIQSILQEILAPSNGDGNDPATLTARLTVSNPTPQLNETVTLQCSAVGDASGAVSFEFQPDDSRLAVNSTTGRASFVIQESDISGAGFSFTCTAESDAATSLPSNAIIIIPTGP